MHRIDHPSAVATLPAPEAQGDPGYYTNGNPGGGIEATVVTADHLNSIQEELVAVIEEAELELDKEDNTQLLQAIQALITAAGVASTLPMGHLYGLGLANNGTDASNDIDFAAGSARDAANSADIILATGLTKRLDDAWAAGTNQGGLFGGSKTNSTWYHCFVIKDPDNNLVDCGFSTNAAASDRPVAYTKYRRLGAVLTDGSGNILAFVANGTGNDREFLWASPTLDINTTYAASARSLIAVKVPTGVKTKASLMYTHDGDPSVNGTWSYWTDPAMADVAPNTSTALAHDTSPLNIGSARHVDVWTNTSQQVGYRPSYAVTLRIRTYSYLETL